MSFSSLALTLGLLLLVMVLTSRLLGRLQITSSIVYLGFGVLLGPAVLGVLRPDPWRDAALLLRVTELALMVSLFSVGLRLGIPLRDARWRLPLRLAFVSLAAMVVLTAAVGWFALGLAPAAALLLRAILSPTDPVLASSIRLDPGDDPERVGHALAAEGGLNDGAAFPFVLLALGMLVPAVRGHGLGHWIAVELLWSTLAGAAIGGACGRVFGRLLMLLRSHHGHALGLDVFVGLGLIGTTYGLAHAAGASGFLAVFAAGLGLARFAEGRPMLPGDVPAGIEMRESVGRFVEQVERLAEMAIVLVLGALLAAVPFPPDGAGFIAVLLLVLRPASVLLAVAGERLGRAPALMIGWFGIRGIGSLYYLMLALAGGIDRPTGDRLLPLVVWTLAASILLHGASALPLMRRARAAHRR